MATATEISTRALKRLGLVQAGDSASAADISDANEALAAMIASWEADWYSGDVLPLDPRFEQGIIAQLAVRLSGDYGVTPGAGVVRDAQRGMEQMQGSFFTVPQSAYESSLTVTSRNNGLLAEIDSLPVTNLPWQAATIYPVRTLVTNNSNRYECTVAGTSASSGGPVGTGGTIVDGTVSWVWRGATA